MRRLMLCIGLVLVLGTPTGAQPASTGHTAPGVHTAPGARSAPARHEVRHSGRIVDVTPDGTTLVLEEMVAWGGPGTGVVTRRIRLTPQTSMQLVKRTDQWEADRTALPGWDTVPLDANSLRPGDFVTVTTDDDKVGVAVSLQVVRPAS
jgi:hypothetical protein